MAPEQLEFTLPLSQAFLDWNLATTLAPVTSGELEVRATDDGFEVTLLAKPRAWVSYLPLVVFALATGGVAFLATPIRFMPAVVGVALVGVTWLRTRLAVSRFLERTNEDVAESFASVPPAPPAVSEQEHT